MAEVSACPKISIVTTLYHSAPYLREFYRRTLEEVKKLGVSYEFVLVNDGSPDASLAIALELRTQDASVTVVDLSRNFGHHKAILAGLSYSRGSRVFLIDCDLEEPPEALSRFNEKMETEECDVVYGVQINRKGGVRERISGWVFYKLFNYLSGIEVPPNWTIARLMSRRYVETLTSYREQSLFLGGIMTEVGFKQAAVELKKLHKGSTTYTFRRKISALVTAVTSFSDKPLRLVFYSGLVIAGVSFLYAFWLVIQKLIFGVTVDGWTALAVSIWLIGGLVILFLGIIGIYIAKIFLQTKDRPLWVVRQVFKAGANSS